LILEIHYIYQESKSDDPMDGWTYFFTEIDDFEKAKKKANTHYKNFIKENGWGRKAKLKVIQKIKNEKDSVPVVAIQPPKPKRRKRTPKVLSRKSVPSPSNSSRKS